VAFVNSAPWGVLTVDGRHVDARVNNMKGLGILNTTLSGGVHRLDYAAPPFRPLHCIVSVPRSASDTCPLADPVLASLASRFQGVGALRVLDLRATPSHLPLDQYQALAQQVLQALAFAPGDVLIGDHYQQQDGTVVAATARLRATLQVSLNTDNSSPFVIGGEPCATLCPIGLGFAAPGGSIGNWGLVAFVCTAWQFADADGHVVSTVPTAPSGPSGLMSMEVQVRWDGAWSVVPSGPVGPHQQVLSSLCQSSISQIIGLLPPRQGPQGFGINTQMGREPGDGCLLVTQQYLGTPIASGPAASPTAAASFLYRYGALVAADQSAHLHAPQLPLPSANERAIIAALVADQHTPAQ
jgi:hypothetical protein